MTKKTISIIGCGAIGTALARYAREELSAHIGKILLCDLDSDRAGTLAREVPGAEIVAGQDAAIDGADLVIEAASPRVVPELLNAAIEKTRDVMIMSIGGVIGNERLLDEAREKDVRVMLPTGAIAGIDAVKAAKIAGIESATLTTRKAPRSLKGAPYLEENKVDLDSITGETVIFEGSAREAIKGFPKNVNVSALLSLAGIGVDRTRVRIIASPEFTSNTHEIEVKSGAGNITIRAENVPSPQNPKTSYLAALAAIAALAGYFDTVRVGT